MLIYPFNLFTIYSVLNLFIYLLSSFSYYYLLQNRVQLQHLLILLCLYFIQQHLVSRHPNQLCCTRHLPLLVIFNHFYDIIKSFCINCKLSVNLLKVLCDLIWKGVNAYLRIFSGKVNWCKTFLSFERGESTDFLFDHDFEFCELILGERVIEGG